MLKKAAQQGRSKRRGDAYFVRYGEPLREARTPLEACFSILLLLALAGCVPSPSSVEAIRKDSVKEMWNVIIWSVSTRAGSPTNSTSTARGLPSLSAEAPKAPPTMLVHCMGYRRSTQCGIAVWQPRDLEWNRHLSTLPPREDNKDPRNVRRLGIERLRSIQHAHPSDSRTHSRPA